MIVMWWASTSQSMCKEHHALHGLAPIPSKLEHMKLCNFSNSSNLSRMMGIWKPGPNSMAVLPRCIQWTPQ